MYTGWLLLFDQLCSDIDRLGGEEAGFRWIDMKQREGKATWHVHFNNKSRENLPACLRMSELILDAIDTTALTCVVCGERGNLSRDETGVLTLCEKHKSQHAKRQLPRFELK